MDSVNHLVTCCINRKKDRTFLNKKEIKVGKKLQESIPLPNVKLKNISHKIVPACPNNSFSSPDTTTYSTAENVSQNYKRNSFGLMSDSSLYIDKLFEDETNILANNNFKLLHLGNITLNSSICSTDGSSENNNYQYSIIDIDLSKSNECSDSNYSKAEDLAIKDINDWHLHISESNESLRSVDLEQIIPDFPYRKGTKNSKSLPASRIMSAHELALNYLPQSCQETNKISPKISLRKIASKRNHFPRSSSFNENLVHSVNKKIETNVQNPEVISSNPSFVFLRKFSLNSSKNFPKFRKSERSKSFRALRSSFTTFKNSTYHFLNRSFVRENLNEKQITRSEKIRQSNGKEAIPEILLDKTFMESNLNKYQEIVNDNIEPFTEKEEILIENLNISLINENVNQKIPSTATNTQISNREIIEFEENLNGSDTKNNISIDDSIDLNSPFNGYSVPQITPLENHLLKIFNLNR